MVNFSIDTPQEIRQYVEERKRVTLTEGRDLLDRLEELVSEVETLRTQVAEVGQLEPATAPDDSRTIPEGLAQLVEQARIVADADHPDSMAQAVFRWCDRWLTVRTSLLTLHQIDQQARDEIQALERDAAQLIERFGD